MDYDQHIIRQAQERFAVFLWLVWQHLGLPPPTPIQIEIADFLQYGDKRSAVHAFRGIGKSWITSAYVLWRLWNNPQLKILIVSATKARADAFSIFTRRLIQEMPLLQHLKPGKDQRDANIAFDVGPARAAHAPSVKSVGITGQMTGSRADLIIPDDIEVLNNSMTPEQREKLLALVGEFESIVVPGGEIKYLGTPQSIESIYRALPGKGYKPCYWPARLPNNKQLEGYQGFIAPSILKRLTEEGLPAGTPVDPVRFNDTDLFEREAAMGRSTFNLQFMLDTTLSDALKYPLKLADLMVMGINDDLAPVQVQHARIKDCVISNIPCIGLAGDRFYKPIYIAPEWAAYSGAVMSIDPSGRGKDQTGYAVVKQLHGNLFAKAVGGIAGGYEKENLAELASIAKQHKVKLIIIESNFGDGMFTELFKPVLLDIHPECGIEEVRHNKQKELRIIDTLEPLLGSHRLVFDQSFVEREVSEAYGEGQDTNYNLFYQMSRITKERRSLTHDDKLDALAIACNYFVEAVAQNDRAKRDEHNAELEQQAIDDFIDGCLNGTNIPYSMSGKGARYDGPGKGWFGGRQQMKAYY